MLKLPKGYKTYTYKAGIKYTDKEDLGIIYSDVPATYSGLYTSNKVYAAPVKICRERKGRQIQLLVVNSGNANACTGEAGYKAASKICKEAEKKFNVSPHLSLPFSTGVIGVNLPIKIIIDAMCQKADTKPEAFARAIMTTDTYPKFITKVIQIEGQEVNITAFTKGSGMINPNLATMLSFIITDADIKQDVLDQLLTECVADTFNAITIDGDMSTNDSVVLLANGKSKVQVNNEHKINTFKNTLFEIMQQLAKEMVKDGEGATKLIEISVEKAKSDKDALKVGQAIANSMLVKTAFFGNDPNWGRILCAAGYSGAQINEEKVELFYLDRFIFKGKPIQYDRKELVDLLMDSKEILIKVILNEGKCSKRIFTCDLSYDYVKINAEYTT